MSLRMMLLSTLIVAVITFFLRAIPFIAFRGERELPMWLKRLGTILPSAIMAVLIVYCLKDVGDDFLHVGVSKLIAVAIVVISYKRKHNTLISILVGTVGYMVLLNIL